MCSVQIYDRYLWLISVHVGAGDTMIRGKKGFKFVDPYAMKTVLQFNGTKVLLLPEHISGQQVSADSFITHRVS